MDVSFGDVSRNHRLIFDWAIMDRLLWRIRLEKRLVAMRFAFPSGRLRQDHRVDDRRSEAKAACGQEKVTFFLLENGISVIYFFTFSRF